MFGQWKRDLQSGRGYLESPKPDRCFTRLSVFAGTCRKEQPNGTAVVRLSVADRSLAVRGMLAVRRHPTVALTHHSATGDAATEFLPAIHRLDTLDGGRAARRSDDSSPQSADGVFCFPPPFSRMTHFSHPERQDRQVRINSYGERDLEIQTDRYTKGSGLFVELSQGDEPFATLSVNLPREALREE